MNSGASFFNFSIDKIAPRHKVCLDSARVRVLYYGLLLSIYILTVLQVNMYYRPFNKLAVINAIMLTGAAILFKWLTYKPTWKAITHILLISGTIISLTDVFIVQQTVGNVTIAAAILMSLFSFYMLGPKPGFVYSLLNIIPVAIFLALQGYRVYSINIIAEQPERSNIIIGLVSCLVLIILIHSYFYRFYLNNDILLKQTYQQQDELNDRYKQAIEKAERSYEEKSAFLATMSHEIRTPLNAVIGMSNLLIMGDPRPDQKENLEVLKFSAGNLLAIVNDVLDFNKIESGKQVFENVQVNLAELMQNICGAQRISAEEKGLSFKLDVDDILNKKEVFAEPARITQVMFNLISNAIKFTHKGSIVVTANCIEQKTSLLTVKFAVKDTGIGIEEDKLKVIFEPFIQQSISTTRQYGGTGLGLTIVKRLLDAQGLRVQIASEAGIGSEFWFTMDFPIATQTQCVAAGQQNSMIQQLAHENNLNDLKVLVAEDNPVNIMLMKKLLAKWKITPAVAENGKRAVELMQDGEFDIVLMDLHMPLMNGFDAAMEIRRMDDPKKARVPIIALTASALFDIKQKIYDSGMNEFISKPFKPTELLEKMQVLTTAIA